VSDVPVLTAREVAAILVRQIAKDIGLSVEELIAKR